MRQVAWFWIDLSYIWRMPTTSFNHWNRLGRRSPGLVLAQSRFVWRIDPDNTRPATNLCHDEFLSPLLGHGFPGDVGGKVPGDDDHTFVIAHDDVTRIH